MAQAVNDGADALLYQQPNMHTEAWQCQEEPRGAGLKPLLGFDP
jgi:hypothetical protein